MNNPKVPDAFESVLGPDILCWGSSLFVKVGNDAGFVAFVDRRYGGTPLGAAATQAG